MSSRGPSAQLKQFCADPKYFSINNCGLCVDVTIVSAFKDLDRTVSDGAGWTIAEAVRQKRRKYEARVQKRGHDFTPFAMNTLGVIDSVAAVPILHRIAERRRERLSGVSPGQVYNHLCKKLIFSQQQAMGIGLKARLVCECIKVGRYCLHQQTAS